MKIIEPKAELWEQHDTISHVAKCARVCYGKEEGNDQNLYNVLKHNKHYSMFRHETHYFIAPMNDFAVEDIITFYHNDTGFDYKTHKGKCYIVLNGHWCINHNEDYKYLTRYESTTEEFNKVGPVRNLIRYTFCLTTQISTTRELNRVSPNNIAERSTRYVEECGAICRPHWMDIEDNGSVWSEMYKDISIIKYIEGCEQQFNNYKSLIDQGMKKEDARGLLPLDTASKVVYTYNIDEWKNIIDLRYHGSTGRPHPNAKLIIGMIRDKLIELGYEL